MEAEQPGIIESMDINRKYSQDKSPKMIGKTLEINDSQAVSQVH
jgi:hypothetical protein